jgi:hypothetical protein
LITLGWERAFDLQGELHIFKHNVKNNLRNK